MANVTFDDASRTDPRFVVLGKLLGTSKFDARGRMLEVYSYCTENGTHFVSSAMLDALVERESFGRDLVAAELAEAANDGTFRIRGTKGRIEWLARLRKNARKGGAANRARLKPSAIPKDSQVDTQMGSQEGTQNEAKAEPSYSGSYSGSYSEEKKSAAASPGFALEPSPGKKQRAKSTGPHAVFLARYFELYQARSSCKPTIGEAEGKIAKALLEAHGLATCLGKLTAAFTGEHWWAKKGDPITLRAFRANFDGLAVVQAPARPLSPLEAKAAYYAETSGWVTLHALAPLEAELEAAGVAIPWLTSELRRSWTHDQAGNPLKAVA